MSFEPQRIDAFHEYLRSRADVPKGEPLHIGAATGTSYAQAVRDFATFAEREGWEDAAKLPRGAVVDWARSRGWTYSKPDAQIALRGVFDYLSWLREQGVAVANDVVRPKLGQDPVSKQRRAEAMQEKRRLAIEARRIAREREKLEKKARKAMNDAANAAPGPVTQAAPTPPPGPPAPEPILPPAPEVASVLPVPGAAVKPRAHENPALSALPARGHRINIYKQVLGQPQPIFVDTKEASSVSSIGSIAVFLQQHIVAPRIHEFRDQDYVSFLVALLDASGREGDKVPVPVEVPRELRARAMAVAGATAPGGYGSPPIVVTGYDEAGARFQTITGGLAEQIRGLEARVPTGDVNLRLDLRDMQQQLRDATRRVEEQIGRAREEARGPAPAQTPLDLSGFAQLAAQPAQPTRSPAEEQLIKADADLKGALNQLMLAQLTSQGPDPIEMLEKAVTLIRGSGGDTSANRDVDRLERGLGALATKIEAIGRPTTSALDDTITAIEKLERITGRGRGGDLVEFGVMAMMTLAPIGERALEIWAASKGVASGSNSTGTGAEPNVPKEIAKAVEAMLTAPSEAEVLEATGTVVEYIRGLPEGEALVNQALAFALQGAATKFIIAMKTIFDRMGCSRIASMPRVTRLAKVLSAHRDLIAAFAPDAARAALPASSAEKAPAPAPRRTATDEIPLVGPAPSAPAVVSQERAEAPASEAKPAAAAAVAAIPSLDPRDDLEDDDDEGDDEDDDEAPTPDEVAEVVAEMDTEDLAEVARRVTAEIMKRTGGSVPATAPLTPLEVLRETEAAKAASAA